jgi:hypothetical protein
MTFLDQTPNNYNYGQVVDNAFRSMLRTVQGKSGEKNVVPQSALEGTLDRFQQRLSDMSRYMPDGFALGISKQFSQMLDEDAWEDVDAVPESQSLDTLIQVLIATSSQRRPGIGTDGLGSISAYWDAENGRLTIDCLPDLSVKVLFSRRQNDGNVARGSFRCKANMVSAGLAAWNPGIWFD